MLLQQVKTHSGSYLGYGVEGIGGKVFNALFRPLGRMRTPPAGLVRIRREVGTTERRRNNMWTWTHVDFDTCGSGLRPFLLHVTVQSGL